MKISVSYCSTKHYPKGTLGQWAFMYKKFTYVKGFILRLFGVYIHVIEPNATEKLIQIAIKQREQCQTKK